jgi:large subunit ribosomal protein L23Ae
VSKAQAAKKAVLQGVHSKGKRKVRHSVTFHRPKTLRLRRDPKYPRKSIAHTPRMDQFRTIISCVHVGRWVHVVDDFFDTGR